MPPIYYAPPHGPLTLNRRPGRLLVHLQYVLILRDIFWFIKFTTHKNNLSYILKAHAGLFVIFATLYLVVFIRLTCWKLEGFANSSSICPIQDLFLKERLDIPTDEIFERVIWKNQK